MAASNTIRVQRRSDGPVQLAAARPTANKLTAIDSTGSADETAKPVFALWALTARPSKGCTPFLFAYG
jgi:hypothetical protein